MAKQTVNNGDSGKTARDKINDNFTELYVSQYRIFELGSQQWREGIRGTSFVRDKTLTALGFAGVEDTDWENTYEDE